MCQGQSQSQRETESRGWTPHFLYADAFVSLSKSRHLKKLKFLPQNVTLVSCMGLSSGRMTYDPHLEDDSQIREIWELGTERPKWPCLLMNALGERVWVCFLAYNGTQGHFHYDVCIWRHKCSGLGVLTSLSHGLVCVSLFLFCKAYCSWHSRAPEPGLEWGGRLRVSDEPAAF